MRPSCLNMPEDDLGQISRRFCQSWVPLHHFQVHQHRYDKMMRQASRCNDRLVPGEVAVSG